MSRRLVRTTAASVVLLLAGCTGGGATTSTGGTGATALDVDVDTPALRAARQRAGIATCPATDGGGAAGTAVLPEVTLPCLGGGPDVDLAGLRGPLVVNLWAQWCGPCREELPHYQWLHERAGGRIAVLGVDYQDPRPDWALQLLRQAGVTFPSVADPGGELRVPLRVRGLPGIVFVDGDGEVAAVEYRVIESRAQLAGLVEEHLGVTVGSPG